MNENPAQKAPTHVAVPISVFAVNLKILGTLPWEQVHQLMAEMMKAPHIDIEGAQQVEPPPPPDPSD